MLIYLVVGATIGVWVAVISLVIMNLVGLEFTKRKIKPDSESRDSDGTGNSDSKEVKIDLVKKIPISSKDITDTVCYNPEIEIVEWPHAKLPITLKYKGMAFALLYKTKTGVVAIVRLAGFYGDMLLNENDGIYRVALPQGSDWYSIPVNGVLFDKKSIQPILSAAYLYVKNKRDYKLNVTKRSGSCVRSD